MDRDGMDELITNVLPSLGAFAPFAVLAWWIISNQSKQLEAKDQHSQKVTEELINTIKVNREETKHR